MRPAVGVPLAPGLHEAAGRVDPPPARRTQHIEKTPTRGLQRRRIHTGSLEQRGGEIGEADKIGATSRMYTYDGATDVTFEVKDMSSIMEANAAYTIRIYYYVESAATMRLIARMDGNFPDIATTQGYHVAEFTNLTSFGWLSFYLTGGSCTWYLGKIEIELTAVN